MSSQSVRKERPNVIFYKYYDCIFVVVKKEIYRVFLWLYEGVPQYVGDYLQIKGIAIRGAKEKAALQRREPTLKFDISFLYSLLQRTCGLAGNNSDIWMEPTTPEEEKSLEHTLYLLKEKRNALSHNPQPMMHMTKEDLDREIIELKQLCSLIIHEAGQKANKPSDEVDKCVNNMEKAFDEIKTNPTPSGYTPEKFAFLGKQEIKGKHLHPSMKNFVTPLIHTKGKTGRHEKYLNLLRSWRCEDGSLPRATVLQGETGTGKTSICQYIFDSWVSCNDEIDDLQDFDLVVPVQCCKVSTRNLIEFLSQDLMPDTVSMCEWKEIGEYMKSLRILWLIDGFEEATVDARELLKKIEEGGTSSHLIFITTKPRKDLSNILTSKDNLCEVSLSGLSGEGIGLLVQKALQETEKDVNICERNKRMFLKEVKALGNEILMELKTPLKLTLILKLWQEGKLSKESGASLFLLYNEIMKLHSKKLVKALMGKSPLSEDILTEKVNNWTQLLCKVAFDMFKNKKYVKIDRISQSKLKEGCENLFMSADDFLSIFLQFQSKDEEGNSSYSFIHNSEQLHLAARHVCLLMKQKTNPDKILKRLFKQNISLEEINHNHIYMMLLHVVSNVALQDTIHQPAAKVLVDLLSMCNDFDAFEVVQCAAYSQVLVKEVSKFTPQEWIVVDHTVKAAMALLEFKMPSLIVLDIDGDPKDLKELINFITKISRRDLILQINLGFHYNLFSSESSDRYLEPICSSDAKCSLSSFAGSLTVGGCQYLTKMSKVRKVLLKVSSNEVLEQIFCNLKYMFHLDFIHLILEMPVVEAPISSYEHSVKEFTICLPFMDKNHINKTASALSLINQHYKEIFLYDISASDAIKFIQKLEEKNIIVYSIVRIIKSDPYLLGGCFRINYGSVPQTSPVSEFYDKWNNTYLFKSENEMGVKVVSLRVEGIPSSDIECFERIGETTFKEIPLSS